MNPNDIKTVQSQELIFEDNNKKARAYVCFCDEDLCVTVVGETKNGEKAQFDFLIELDTLKTLAHAHNIHCERCRKEVANESA